MVFVLGGGRLLEREIANNGNDHVVLHVKADD